MWLQRMQWQPRSKQHMRVRFAAAFAAAPAAANKLLSSLYPQKPSSRTHLTLERNT